MEEELSMLTNEEIKNLIYTIRGKQVMLDSDVAMLYHYPTKRINEAVRRNKERFPEKFCIQLNEQEIENMRSQFATAYNNVEKYRNKNKLPYVFTEQGIAMLSGLLKNEIAVQVSIHIMDAFVEMRKFLNQNGQVFDRLTTLEYKQIENEKNFDLVFNQLQISEVEKQKIFYKGQIYDAYSLIMQIIKKANKKILIIDNYIDDSILEMLTKKKENVEAVIITSNKCNISNLDIKKFNKEYPTLKIARTESFHDRFILIDNKELYHCGASIKDLGKKCFAINKVENKEFLEVIIKTFA